MENKLKFRSFESSVSNGFWFKLQEKKLHEYKLDDSSQQIKGFYTNTDSANLPCRLTLDHGAFETRSDAPPLCFNTIGKVYNKNTIEDFKNTDLKLLLEDQGRLLLESIVCGDAVNNPELLVRFLLLSFADLKKFKFFYWFAYPAISQRFDAIVNKSFLIKEIDASFLSSLSKSTDQFCERSKRLPPFFVLSGESLSVHHLNHTENLIKLKEKLVFGFCDPSTSEYFPGWPLRNYLTLIHHHWADQINNEIEILCYRERFTAGKRENSHSLYLKLNLRDCKQKEPSFCGWEKNLSNKYAPRVANLSSCMDPERLAQSSVNLNLKLMQWRLMPDLKLDMIANTKCLLLGSGTLGCNVARGLLGWGVTNITLVDNGSVSFSNPVRQTLFDFSDCGVSGGKSKAFTAAKRLKEIYPGVNAKGVELSIPMPGHPIYNSEKLVEKLKADLDLLTKMIQEHDVIFLLMDTRESRWLPSVIGAANGKLVISAAIGFDTYLVMRHGALKIDEEGKPIYSDERLGCYFCADIVAPSNSTNDRTLDQQCTVSRPGVSMIASAMAVELMVSVLHHPDQVLSKGCNFSSSQLESSILGPVAHQIRGFIHNFENMYPMTPAFDRCTACSKTIIEHYRAEGHDFLLKVFNSTPRFLEDISGLTQLYDETALVENDVLEYGDEEDVCDD